MMATVPVFEIVDAAAGISAGSGSWTAPSRDIDGAVASATANGGVGDLAEWDTYPPCADMDQKLSQGLEQSSDQSPVSGACFDAGGACFPSLDPIENNRHKTGTEPEANQVKTKPHSETRPVGRANWCGRWSLRGLNPVNGRMCTRRMNCKTWACSYCGPRRAKMARTSIRNNAEALGLKYFLTLTLDPSKIEFIADRSFAVPYMRQCWNKFREYLRREFGCPPSFIAVLEFTKSGAPHLHVLLDRFIDQRWISATWDSLGGGRICFIKQVKVVHVARYLSKYLTKELLLSAPKGSRRTTSSRSVKLFPKWVGQHTTQEIVKTSVWALLEEQRVSRRFTDAQPNLLHREFLLLERDEERFLSSFELVEIDFSEDANT